MVTFIYCIFAKNLKQYHEIIRTYKFRDAMEDLIEKEITTYHYNNNGSDPKIIIMNNEDLDDWLLRLEMMYGLICANDYSTLMYGDVEVIGSKNIEVGIIKIF